MGRVVLGLVHICRTCSIPSLNTIKVRRVMPKHSMKAKILTKPFLRNEQFLSQSIISSRFMSLDIRCLAASAPHSETHESSLRPPSDAYVFKVMHFLKMQPPCQ
jgi:hypothetical protein